MTSGQTVNFRYGAVAGDGQSAVVHWRRGAPAEHHRRPARARRRALDRQLFQPRPLSSPTDLAALRQCRAEHRARRRLLPVRSRIAEELRAAIINEASRLEFRTESFNLFNKTNFGAPNSTFAPRPSANPHDSGETDSVRAETQLLSSCHGETERRAEGRKRKRDRGESLFSLLLCLSVVSVSIFMGFVRRRE